MGVCITGDNTSLDVTINLPNSVDRCEYEIPRSGHNFVQKTA